MVALHAGQALVSIETSDGIKQTVDHHNTHSQALGMHRLYKSPAIQIGVIAARDLNK